MSRQRPSLAERIARFNAEIQAEREAREQQICQCGHAREHHADFRGSCCVGDHHCFSFVSAKERAAC